MAGETRLHQATIKATEKPAQDLPYLVEGPLALWPPGLMDRTHGALSAHGEQVDASASDQMKPW